MNLVAMAKTTATQDDVRDKKSIWTESEKSNKHRSYVLYDEKQKKYVRRCQGCKHVATAQEHEIALFESAKSQQLFERVTMSSTPTVPGTDKGIVEGAMSAVTSAGEVLANNMKATLAATAVQTTLSAAKAKLPEGFAAMLDTPVGDAIAQLAIPFLVMTACEAYGASMPGADAGKKFAQLALNGVAAQKMGEIAGAIQPIVAEFISAGMSMAREQLQPGAPDAPTP